MRSQILAESQALVSRLASLCDRNLNQDQTELVHRAGKVFVPD